MPKMSKYIFSQDYLDDTTYLATIEFMEKQDKKWREQVFDIMDELQITTYPTQKQFIQTGRKQLYKEIEIYAGHPLYRELLQLRRK